MLKALKEFREIVNEADRVTRDRLNAWAKKYIRFYVNRAVFSKLQRENAAGNFEDYKEHMLMRNAVNTAQNPH